MNTKMWVNTQHANNEMKPDVQANEGQKEQACCGRSYNEESDFSQINFATFQSILDKRNELLSGVKPQTYYP